MKESIFGLLQSLYRPHAGLEAGRVAEDLIESWARLLQRESRRPASVALSERDVLLINYLDALSKPAEGEAAELAARKFLTAHAILLSLQGVPGIYFHSLFGSRGDRVGAEASGIPRRINREKLDRVRLETEFPFSLSPGPGNFLPRNEYSMQLSRPPPRGASVSPVVALCDRGRGGGHHHHVVDPLHV